MVRVDPAVRKDEARPKARSARVVVVIAAYDEAGTIGYVVRGLAARGWSVLVVDDGSSDGTAGVAEGAGAFVLRHRLNRGQGAALQTGIDFALARDAHYVVTFDADGQHDPADVDVLLDPLLGGECEVVLGSRFLGRAEGMPWTRRLVLKLGVVFTRLTSGIAVSDTHNGLRAFTAAAARRLHITLDRMAHASEILDQVRASRLAWREVPVCVRYTAESLRKGQSSWGAAAIAARVLWRRLIS